MKQKSPISVGKIQFYTYNCDQIDDLVFIEQFPYDNRTDFLVNRSLGGVAVKIEIENERSGKGARRNVAFQLVDVTARCEVAVKSARISLRESDSFKNEYVYFPANSYEIKPGNTYKLLVSDLTASQTLYERVFHLFDKDSLPHPVDWYAVCDAGIRCPWGDELYKTVKAEDCQQYYVRFNITQKFGSMLPSILPQLEMRLFYPNGRYVEINFSEPQYTDSEHYKSGERFVEFPFTTISEYNGVFYAELLCMEYPIAGFVFDSNADNDQGTWSGKYLKPLEEYSLEAAGARWADGCAEGDESASEEDDKFIKLLDEFINCGKSSESEDETADVNTNASCDIDDSDKSSDADHQNILLPSLLDHLTGLRSVKAKLTVYERVVRFNKLRTESGLPTTSAPLHAMFLGSPGTGKTTVAKMMGMILHRAGVLSKGHVVVRERATLLGQNYNSEAENTIAAIKEAQGGILLIDEAYQLYQPNDPRDPGKFVIDTLLTALADETNRDWMLVLAGYPDDMKRMFDMNPGFKSRIPESNIYLFEDFTEEELVEIAEKYFSRYHYSLSPEARDTLCTRLSKDYKNRKRTFGNARHVINLIQTEIIPAMAVRVTNHPVSDPNALIEIKAADIPDFIEPIPDTSRPIVGFVK